MTKIQLGVHGAAGRMGRRVVALAAEDAGFELIAAVEHDHCALLGQDAGVVAAVSPVGVDLTPRWPEDAASIGVVIDFSLPDAVEGCVQWCLQHRRPLVVATTGLTESQQAGLVDASASIPVVWAPSMSLAVNLTMKLAERVTETLGEVAGGVDIEILERHHRFKADAPSGTALKFGEVIAERMKGGEVRHVHGRHGETGQRTQNEIGYHAIRVADNPGEHTVVFGMMGERIELKVAASNRDCYASGALAAAKWIGGRPAGLYNMFDVLGLSDSVVGSGGAP